MTKKKEAKVDYKKVAEELATENAKLNESLLRERADAMNVRKRADEERIKLAGYFKAGVVKEILPVIDNFDRAIKSQESGNMSHEELQKGVDALHKQFEKTLVKLGVERIKTVGEHFDPELHHAVTMDVSSKASATEEEGDGNSPAGEEIVSEELQSGYKIGEELLRPAMVRVKS